MERVDQAYLNEILVSLKNDDDPHSDDGSKPKAGDVKVLADKISYDEIMEEVCETLMLSVSIIYSYYLC